MSSLLIDTCGWVALIEGRLNLDLALRDVLGPTQLYLLPVIQQELEQLEATESKQLLLELLLERAEVVDAPDSELYSDDQLLSLAQAQGWPVLTVDTELKRRLLGAGCSVVEVVAGRHLRLIE